MRMGLTSAQRRCYDAIVSEVGATGRFPTVGRVAVLCGLSTKSKARAHAMLGALCERGYLRRLHRSYVLSATAKYFVWDDALKTFRPLQVRP